MTRQVSFLIYPDFQLLDAAGPIAAFEIAERQRPGSYSLRVVASEAGSVMSSAGVSMQANSFGRPTSVDTLIVAGGDGSRSALSCPTTRRFIQSCAAKARRTSSVCSGAYLLAAAGILDGKRATTHWSRSIDFARRFPRVRVEPDRIFIKDGPIWTSAGITAGIDLSLALIEEDLGQEIARRTAQQLVVYFRRPGGQSQFSALLEMERANGRFAPLLDYVRSNLGKHLSVAVLAERACMSPRHFSRAFHAETGMPPAKAVEQLRAEAARGTLSGTGRSVHDIARSHGFGNAERMRRTFLRLFGVTPSAVKHQRR
ncbi:MAG TPA: GlxA family transcriptional regulator [Steroidobacteraceae bacterium]|jgi:transcriptional regulator GlxA family with amidase domain|nr:GlxA family transcriptional regulator [Steroidobacteraceae bacterium]